jgi:hypothetical protein
MKALIIDRYGKKDPMREIAGRIARQAQPNPFHPRHGAHDHG